MRIADREWGGGEGKERGEIGKGSTELWNVGEGSVTLEEKIC